MKREDRMINLNAGKSKICPICPKDETVIHVLFCIDRKIGETVTKETWSCPTCNYSEIITEKK